jgi:nucleoside-diphosphate kinase
LSSESPENSITNNYSLSQDVGRNVCHGSDAVESAQKEIALWFKPEELQSWKQASHDWVYEK